jgi:hypothetical protein
MEFWPFHELGPHRGPPWPDEVLRLAVYVHTSAGPRAAADHRPIGVRRLAGGRVKAAHRAAVGERMAVPTQNGVDVDLRQG